MFWIFYLLLKGDCGVEDAQMKGKTIRLKGTGKPMSDEALQQLKKEIKASRDLAKVESKVDSKILKLQFNV